MAAVRPRWVVALGLGGFALAVRLGVIGLTLLLGRTAAEVPASTPEGGHGARVALADIASLHDGREYLATAAALGDPTAMAELDPGSRRLAPGYPMMVRAAESVTPSPVAGLGVSAVTAGVATSLVYLLGVPAAGAALFAVLTPSWVAFSATAMSEAPFTAMALLGLLIWRRRGAVAQVLAGVIFAGATMVRPVGGILFAALWVARMSGVLEGTRSDRRRSAVGGLASAAGFLMVGIPWLATSGWVRGPATQASAYLQRDLAMPAASLLSGFTSPLLDPLKTAQNVVVLGLVLASAWLLARRWRHADPASGEWLVWLGSQTLFYLLLPSAWVFECLARFLVPTLPAVAVALAPSLPRRRAMLVLIIFMVTVVSAGISVLWNLRALGSS